MAADDEKTFNPTTLMGCLLLAGITAWVGSIQMSIRTTQNHAPRLEAVEKRCEANHDWHVDWQKNGQLPGDVKQDTEILALKEQVKMLTSVGNNTSDRLTRLEERQTSIQKSVAEIKGDVKAVLGKLDAVLMPNDPKNVATN